MDRRVLIGKVLGVLLVVVAFWLACELVASLVQGFTGGQ